MAVIREEQRPFSWKAASRITLQAVVPCALVLAAVMVFSQAAPMGMWDAFSRMLEVALWLLLGMFGFCFPFIVLARYIALRLHSPVKWQTYTAILVVLYAPLASFVAYQLLADQTTDVPSDMVRAGVSLLISAGALPMLMSSFLFYSADKKTTQPSPSHQIQSA